MITDVHTVLVLATMLFLISSSLLLGGLTWVYCRRLFFPEAVSTFAILIGYAALILRFRELLFDPEIKIQLPWLSLIALGLIGLGTTTLIWITTFRRRAG